MNSSVGVGSNPQTRQVRQFCTSTQLSKFLFSDEMCLALQKLLKYDFDLVITLSAGQLKEACQRQLRRLQALKLKDKIPRNLYLDNQLAATAINHQLRALAELHKANQEALRKLGSPAKKGAKDQEREELVTRRYEAIQGQIQKSDSQVRAFMESEVLGRVQIDLQLCHGFFGKHSRRLKRSSNEKLIIFRARLLEALAYCLKQAHKMLHPQEELPEEEKEEEAEDDLSSDSQAEGDEENRRDQLSYSEINRWKRMASRALSDKMEELAAICEQIPQLEAFSRTLQFSKLSSAQRVSFLRVVDVLVSLHHRVSYLSRNKPHLLRQLELAQEELLSLNSGCQAFLQQLEQRSTLAELATLRLQGESRRHGQLGEGFLQLRRLLGKMAQVIVNQDLAHSAGFDRADRLLQLVRLFMRAHRGREGEEWEQLVGELAGEGAQGVSEEEYELIMELQECLLDFQARASLEQQSTSKTNQELEEEVNKLIADYQRLKAENKQQVENLQMLARMREDLEMEIQERDNMIYNLSGIKVTLEKRLANNEGNGEAALALQEELKKQERETQKYLESSLLLREQLKVSQNEREKLLQLLEAEKQKNLKLFQTTSRLKPEKERLQLDNEDLQERLEKAKNDHQRQLNKLNKQLNDLTNERDLLEQQLATAESNKAKLLDRLEANEKRIADYSRLVITRVEEREREGPREHSRSQETLRLEEELERVRKQFEKSRKECDNRRVEIDSLDRENSAYQLQIAALKAKLKESRLSQEEAQEKDDLIRELKSKLEKGATRLTTLLREMEGVREEEEQTATRNRALSKRLKELQATLAESEAESIRLSQQLQQKNNFNNDLQKNLASQAAQFNQQIKHLKEVNFRQEEELREKGNKVETLERKIERLETELANRRTQGEEASKELAEVKMKQFETTIQTHKLLQVKLEEQARTLKSQLEEKIEVEIKLNLQIDRLSKEIDRMKQQLQKFLRELAQKEQLIKIERQRNDEQVKIIREFQVKEKIQQEGLTPIRPNNQKRREDDTPSHIEDRDNPRRHQFPGDSRSVDNSILSKSNLKYDIYFNAKEYDRLQKEYNDFRSNIGQKVEQLEHSLQQARKSKVEYEIKYNNLLIENKRIINSNTISAGGDSSITLDNKLQQANAAILHNQNTINSLNQQLVGLQNQLKAQQMEINQLKQKQFEMTRQQQEFASISTRITQYQSSIAALQKGNQNLLREKDSYLKRTLELQGIIKQKVSIEEELRQAKITITNLSLNPTNNIELQRLKRTIQELNDQISRLQKEKRSEVDASQLREKEQFIRERDQAFKEREEMRQQHDEMRRHITEQTKRTVSLEVELTKLKEELKKRENLTAELLFAKKRIEELENRLNTTQPTDKQPANIDYYLEKIRSLEEALLAVGDELADSKEALYRELSRDKNVFAGSREYNAMLEDIQRLFNDNQYFHNANQQLVLQIQTLKRNEIQWIAKEKLFLQELQAMSRENVSLKDHLNRPSDKQITTTLPPKLNPININYHESRQDLRRQRSHDFEQILRQMDAVVEGRTRWDNSKVIESLHRWRVPMTVVNSIEEILNFLSQTVQLIKIIRQDYANLRDLNPNAVLFENLLEFVFRVLVYFSDISSNSAEAGKIKNELAELTNKYSGGIFFTVLESFTIHILENNAIEEYKKELKAKANELLLIKEKLDELISEQIYQEQSMVNCPRIQRSRDTTPYKESPTASPKPKK